MRQKKTSIVPPSKFHKEPMVVIDGFEIVQGDIIKIQGEHGIKFKFSAFVTNTETGVQWVDCIELDRGALGGMRSFYVERVKRVPVKRKRAKRVV
jgi:hypothetical protein